MKRLYCSTVLSAIVLSSIFAACAHAESSRTYTCVGINSDGEEISSTLTLTPTDKSDLYKSVWVYTKPGSSPDEGEVNVLGKNRMSEIFKSQHGLDVGKTDLYQITSKQIVISHENFHKAKKLKTKGAGVCNLVE